MIKPFEEINEKLNGKANEAAAVAIADMQGDNDAFGAEPDDGK